MSKSLSKSRFIEMFGDPNSNAKGYDKKPLRDLFALQMGKTPPRKEMKYWTDATNKWISISDMSTYDKYTTDTKEKIADCAISDTGIKVVPKNTVIMSFKLSIGKTAITSEDIYTNEAIMAFVKKNEKINNSFLSYALKMVDWTSTSSNAVKGVTLNKEIIGNKDFFIPPIELQNEFEIFSNQVDKSKFILQKMIEKLELLKKSRFVEMFGNIKETIPLENCCSLISDFVASGSFASLRDNVKYYDKENYAVLVRTIDFANNFSKDLVYTDKHGYDFLSKTNLYGGEILLSNIGASIGKVFRVPYLNKPMTLAPNSIVIKPNDNYTNEFLEYFFSIGRGQDELHVMTTATATPKFNKTQLRQVPVPKVSKEIQNDFSCFVKQLDKSKLILQKQLEDLVGETK